MRRWKMCNINIFNEIMDKARNKWLGSHSKEINKKLNCELVDLLRRYDMEFLSKYED